MEFKAANHVLPAVFSGHDTIQASYIPNSYQQNMQSYIPIDTTFMGATGTDYAHAAPWSSEGKITTYKGQEKILPYNRVQSQNSTHFDKIPGGGEVTLMGDKHGLAPIMQVGDTPHTADTRFQSLDAQSQMPQLAEANHPQIQKAGTIAFERIQDQTSTGTYQAEQIMYDNPTVNYERGSKFEQTNAPTYELPKYAYASFDQRERKQDTPQSYIPPNTTHTPYNGTYIGTNMTNVIPSLNPSTADQPNTMEHLLSRYEFKSTAQIPPNVNTLNAQGSAAFDHLGINYSRGMQARPFDHMSGM